MISFVLSAVLHGILLFSVYSSVTTLGDEHSPVKKSIAISYNQKEKEEKVDGFEATEGDIEQAEVEEIVSQDSVEVKETLKTEQIVTADAIEETPEIPEIVEKQEKKVEKEIPKKSKIKKPKKSKKYKAPKKSVTASKSIQGQDKVDPMNNGNFIANSDGSYTALSSKGIPFVIIKQFDPAYPRKLKIPIVPRKIVVETRFLVGLNGRVESIEILNSGNHPPEFNKNVISALKKWRFKPITLNGKKLKVYFIKKFIFN